jgi:replication factor A1
LIIGDETGTIRVVFWNDQVEVALKIKEEDIISVKDGYVKENNAQKEVHLGERASVAINPPGEVISSVRQAMAAGRKKIGELVSGDEGVEVFGTVVQVFDPRFFTVCSQCNKRATEEAGGFRCAEHGIVQPQQAYVMNVVLDDGTGTIRSIFWRNQTNHLLGKEESHMVIYKENLSAFEEVKTDLLGEQLKIIGRVQRNEMFDRLEFNVQLVEKANPEEELARLEKS